MQLLALNGWRILMTHIVGMPPQGARVKPLNCGVAGSDM